MTSSTELHFKKTYFGTFAAMVSYSLKKSQLSSSKVQPITITRAKLQKRTYGAWYSSFTVLQYENFMTKELWKESKFVILISRSNQNKLNKYEK